MVSRVKRYFLEIKDFSNTIDLNLPENYKIILDDKNDFLIAIVSKYHHYTHQHCENYACCCEVCW